MAKTRYSSSCFRA